MFIFVLPALFLSKVEQLDYEINCSCCGSVSPFQQDDCCDRSIESEVSTLHSQDEMMSEEHKDGLDVSARSTDDMTSGAKGSLHHTSDPLLLPGRDRPGGEFHSSHLVQFNASRFEDLPICLKNMYRVT
jgi:hypothetical protein